MSAYHDDEAGQVWLVECDVCGEHAKDMSGAIARYKTEEAARGNARVFGGFAHFDGMRRAEINPGVFSICGACTGLSAAMQMATKKHERIRNLERYLDLLEAFIDGETGTDVDSEIDAVGAS